MLGDRSDLRVPDGMDQVQTVLDDLYAENSLESKFVQLTDGMSINGGSVIKAWRDSDGSVHVDLVPLTAYFPSFDPDDSTRLTGATIAWERIDETSSEKYIVREIHRPGTVERQVLNSQYQSDEEKMREWYPDILQGEVPTGYDGLLVEYVPNNPPPGEFWGLSDYDNIRDLIEEIMVRVSDNADVLSKHAHPMKVLATEMLGEIQRLVDEHSDALARSGIVNRAEADVMTRGNNVPSVLDAAFVPSEFDKGNLPRYLTWDASMTSAFEHLKNVYTMLMALTAMPPDVFGLTDYGAAASGRAMQFRFAAAIALAKRKKKFMLPPLQRIISAALALSGYTVEPRDISIVTGDGLPDDQLEQAQVATMLYSGQLASQKSAMFIARSDLTEKQADAEITEMSAKSESAWDMNLDGMTEAATKAVNPDGGNSGKNTQATGAAAGA